MTFLSIITLSNINPVFWPLLIILIILLIVVSLVVFNQVFVTCFSDWDIKLITSIHVPREVVEYARVEAPASYVHDEPVVEYVPEPENTDFISMDDLPDDKEHFFRMSDDLVVGFNKLHHKVIETNYEPDIDDFITLGRLYENWLKQHYQWKGTNELNEKGVDFLNLIDWTYRGNRGPLNWAHVLRQHYNTAKHESQNFVLEKERYVKYVNFVYFEINKEWTKN